MTRSLIKFVMKIFIPDLCVPNTYIHDLAFALEELGHEIIWNSDNLFFTQWVPDVILSQWAEQYFRTSYFLQKITKLNSEHLQLLKKKLDWIKEKTLIVAFVHNVQPRKTGIKEFDRNLEKLFQINYESAHAFVHLGKQSISDFNKYYPELADKNKPSLISSQGLHELLKLDYPSIEKASAVSDEFRIFVPGAIRYWSELTFLVRAFLAAKVPKKQLIIAGGGYILEGSPLKPFRRTLLKNISRVSLFGRRLDDETLSRELMTADLVIAPRIQATNSGIPYLAATYGKRCLGPNVGNVPEALKELNGILFEPGDRTSLTRAIEKAYSDREMFSMPDPPCPSWHEIAKQIEAFIISLKTNSVGA
jgi:glycosyltransferase involved in cell wall biosynthesis